MKIFTSVVLLFVFIPGIIKCQVQSEIEQILKSSDGNIEFVSFNTKTSNYQLDDAQKVINKYFNLSSNNSFSIISSSNDSFGYQHVKMQHFYKGVKVEYSMVIVHCKNSFIDCINGNILDPKNIDINSSLHIVAPDYDLITNVAKKYSPTTLDSINFSNNQDNELIIFKNRRDNTFHLGFKYLITNLNDNNEYYLYYDVNKNSIIKCISTSIESILPSLSEVTHSTSKINDKKSYYSYSSATGSADARYSGPVSITTEFANNFYRLEDLTRGNGILVKNAQESILTDYAINFIDWDNIWNAAVWHNEEKDDAALEAFYAIEHTYDYFRYVHQRYSYDNNNSQIKCYVHYGEEYPNAKWRGSEKDICLGDGNDITFDALASIDIVAHEFTHGVSQEEVDFVYEGEPGAVCEAISDIFGACVEAYTQGTISDNTTWLHGEEAKLDQIAQRSLRNPGELTYYYDDDEEYYAYPDTYECGEGWIDPSDDFDEGGVHVNSTVLSHWFYLLTEGGAGTNCNNDCYFVTPIGISKSRNIVYYAVNNYLTSSCSFTQFAFSMIVSAQTLYGVDSNEKQQTIRAVDAVGLLWYDTEAAITGPDLLCYPTNGSYTTFEELPSGTSYSWSQSGYLDYVSGQNTDTYTVEPNTSSIPGTETVYLTYNAGCGNVSISKNLWINKPRNATGHSINYSGESNEEDEYCMEEEFTFTLLHQNSSFAGITYYWNIDGSPYYGTSPSRIIETDLMGDYSLYVYMSNTCGSSSLYYYYWDVVMCEGGFGFSMYPNPTYDMLTIEFEEKNPELKSKIIDQEVKEIAPIEIKVFDFNNRLLIHKTSLGESVQISLRELLAGKYIIQVISCGETQSRIIIKE